MRTGVQSSLNVPGQHLPDDRREHKDGRTTTNLGFAIPAADLSSQSKWNSSHLIMADCSYQIERPGQRPRLEQPCTEPETDPLISTDAEALGERQYWVPQSHTEGHRWFVPFEPYR